MDLRRQAVVLVLVGLATLTVVHLSGQQDWTRIELTRSLAALAVATWPLVRPRQRPVA